MMHKDKWDGRRLHGIHWRHARVVGLCNELLEISSNTKSSSFGRLLCYLFVSQRSLALEKKKKEDPSIFSL